MMAEIQWWLFLLASLAVILTPGQDMVIVLTRSVAQGTAAGLATAVGVGTGLLAHTLLAVMGLGLVLQASATLFWLIKTLGAAYLVFLGIRLVITANRPLAGEGPGVTLSPLRLFRDGFISNLANPKIIVFYIAFLPQFIPLGIDAVALPLLLLGALYSLMALVVKGSVALFAGYFSRWLRDNSRMLVWLHRAGGVVLVGLGGRLLLESSGP